LALLNVTALAQTQAPAAPGAGTVPAQVQHKPAIDPLTQADVSKIEGTDVYGGDDKSVGHISQVLMNPDTKKIDRLVVAAGGVLGIGSHRVALPVDQFTWDSDRGAFKIPQTMAGLKSMPEWREAANANTGGQTSGGNNAPTAAH
jgi:sporulation protein YlmC with PRC-barrel domain